MKAEFLFLVWTHMTAMKVFYIANHILKHYLHQKPLRIMNQVRLVFLFNFSSIYFYLFFSASS